MAKSVVKAPRLSERMALAKISQSELARRVGMTQQGIQSILAGAVERPIDLNNLARCFLLDRFGY